MTSVLTVAQVLIAVLSSDSVRAQATPSLTLGIKDTPPFISAIVDQTVEEDSPAVLFGILYGDAETPMGELRISVESSNPRLLPVANVLFNFSTPQKMAMITAHDQHGVATVTLTVEDAQGNKSSRSFRLTVNPVNDPPRVAAQGSLTVVEDGPPQTVSIEVTDPESRSEELTVSAASANAALIPNSNLSLEGTGKDRKLTLRPAADQFGAAVVVLTVRDPQGAQTRLELNVRVFPANDPPRLGRIADQRIFMNQILEPIPLALIDDETSLAELILEGTSSNPQLVPPGNIFFGGSEDQRTISVRPARNLTGTTLITVKGRDGERQESSTSFLLTVDRETLAPEIAGLAPLTVDQDKTAGPLPFTVSDVDGPVELVRVEATSSNPALVPPSGIQLGGAGRERSLTLRPNPGASGVAEITLIATDGEGIQGRASFLLTVRAVALRPTAQALSLTVAEDTAMEILLKGENPSGRSLAYGILAPPQKGELTGQPPRLTYMPKPNVSGSDSFQFKVTDGPLESLPATVSITIQEVNDPPTISSVANRRTEPGKATVPIRFAVEDLETPSNKLVVTGRSSDPDLIPDPGILFTGQDTIREVSILPAAGRSGTATITLTVKDGGGLSASTAFELKVSETLGAPKADPQSVITPEDVPIAIALRVRDSDGQAIRFEIVDAPARGTLSGFAPNLVYRPKTNENGPDRFTFKAVNAAGESAAAAVEILILPLNDPPVARSQNFTIKEDTALEIELTAGDPDKDALTYEILSFPTKGEFSGSPPRLTYTPKPNEVGLDQFTFAASDGDWVSGPGTIRITISPVNDPPSASGFSVSGPEDMVIPMTLKGRDVDGDPLVYTIGTLPAKGVLAGTPPDLIYVPNPNANGLDRFTYRVSDGNLSSEQQVVNVLLIPVNDAPVAEGQFLSLAEDSSVDILLGARDADNDALTFTLVSGPSRGSISGTAPRLTYRPEANFNGIDSVTFKVSDGMAESAPAVLNLSVRSIADPPITQDQFATVNEDESQGIVLTGRDVDGGLLLYQVVDRPKQGSLSGVPPNLVYTPARNFNGEDGFSFKVTDGDLESAPATVRIFVRPVNDAPVAENQFVTVTQGRSRLVALTGADAEGGISQFILTSLPTKGLLSGKPPELTYIPNPNERGLDSFSFKVSDGTLESLPATVQLALIERSSAPTISTIPDQISRNGEPTARLSFTIGDAETSADKLGVAASSSSPGVVALEKILLEGSGAQRTVRVIPTIGQFGATTITLVVWDEDGLAASSQFTLTAVQENRAPTVDWINPPDLSVVDPKSPLVLEAKAADPDGAIQRVEFYAGSTLIGTSTKAPYQFTWDTPVQGRQTLSAKAIDDRAGTASSTPIEIQVARPAGSVAILTSGSDPDLALIRQYLFERPVRWRMIARAEARIDEMIRQYDAVLWHQTGGGDMQPQDLNLLESLAKVGMPLYFLGDSLLASSRRLADGERGRWQNLIHLKPGGTGWLNQIAILGEVSHPVIRNGPAGAVARFSYPVSAQQAGVQMGLPLEVVLGRSGSFDLLVAAEDAKTSTRTFTHHLRLGGAADEFGMAEQSKLFKNAMAWLLERHNQFDLGIEVETPTEAVVVGQPFQYRIVVRHSGESSASQVAVTDTLPPELSVARAEMTSGSWSQKNGIATFELGTLTSAEVKSITVTAIATRAGSYAHRLQVQASGTDSTQENDTYNARFTAVDTTITLPKLILQREGRDTIRVELSGAGAGRIYALETSVDLIHWSRLNVELSGPGSSVKLPSTAAARQFFRVLPASALAAVPPAAQR